MTTTDIHALVGAYALDAVDDLERAAFERHIRECDGCRGELDELRETASRLADSTWSIPPPRLRTEVLGAIGRGQERFGASRSLTGFIRLLGADRFVRAAPVFLDANHIFLFA